jgi:hypothetical protein
VQVWIRKQGGAAMSPDVTDWLESQGWPECKELLSSASSISRHPYGFVVARIAVDGFDDWQFRIHLWPAAGSKAIRDRRFNIHADSSVIHSRVLAGELLERQFITSSHHRGSYRVMTVVNSHGMGERDLVPTDELISVETSSEKFRTPGSGVYSIRGGDYHSTDNFGEVTAISLSATAVDAAASSKAIAPASFQDRVPDRRQPVSESELAALISELEATFTSES